MLNIVLFEPEIAGNVGNIGRSCVGFNAKLHLIRPYGFYLNSAEIKRSGANYWEFLEYTEYDSFDDFLKINQLPKNLYIYTRYGTHTPAEIEYPSEEEIYLMFGRESTGVPENILKQYQDHLIRIPTTTNLRSLNLSNTVAIASYEVCRQSNYSALSIKEPHKSKF